MRRALLREGTTANAPNTQRVLRKLLVAAILLTGAASAQAAFPGINGAIVFSRCEVANCSTVNLWSIRPGQAAWPLGVQGNDRNPGVSAAGERMVFQSCQNVGWRCGIKGSDRDGHYGRVSLTTGSDNTIIDDFPSFSLDGGTVIFQRCPSGGPCAIWSVPAAGGAAGQLSHPLSGESDSGPVFSPDGSQIAFQHCPGAGSGCEIDVMAPNGSGQTALTTRPVGADDDAPSWSPNGTRIAFQRCCDANG